MPLANKRTMLVSRASFVRSIKLWRRNGSEKRCSDWTSPSWVALLGPDPSAARLGKLQLGILLDRKTKRPKREILLPHTDPTRDGRPVRSEVRTSIVKAVALGRRRLSELASGEVLDTEVLANREQRSKRSGHR